MNLTGDSEQTGPSKLCHLLNTDRPVLLAPMAGVAGGELAAAVSKSGGFGIVGGGYGDLDALATEMALTTGTAVGVGLITWTTDHATVRAVLDYEPVAIWLSFGDATPYIPLIRDSGVTVICQVTTVEEGQAVAEAGADIIVAQGDESGGHGRSGRSLFGLLPALHAALPDTPLVAAGGINGRQEFDAACALGASGVALGTAYYATNEAQDSPEAKQHLVQTTGDQTVRGIVYDLIRGPEWPPEFDGRPIQTELTDRWTGREVELRGNPQTEALRYERAVAENDMSIRVVFAGEGLDAIDAVIPAAEISQRFPICR